MSGRWWSLLFVAAAASFFDHTCTADDVIRCTTRVDGMLARHMDRSIRYRWSGKLSS
jgi:hypothetical protein